MRGGDVPNFMQEDDDDAVEGEEGQAAAPPVSDFETAIEACTYGRFHILLLLMTQPVMAAAIFETTSMAYIFPAAECDLNLSLMDKGFVNAITYAGMIASAVPWGFLADTTGRKYTLIYGMLLDSVCVLGAATSQSFTQLLIFKFFGGFFSCGPFAIIMSYLSEFHSRKSRARVMMAIGMMKNVNVLLLPALALAMLPFRFEFTLFGLKLYNWHVFLAITGVFCLLTGLLLFGFPESPRFLMSQGRNAEALEVFQRIYAINTGAPRLDYPVKHLFDEAPERSAAVAAAATAKKNAAGAEAGKPKRRRIVVQKFGDGLRQLKPLFSSPLLCLSLIVYTMNFGLLMSQNTIRLWLPQIFVSMEEYEQNNMGATTMCNILEYNVNKTRNLEARNAAIDGECTVHITPASYVNNVITATAAFVGSMVASLLVNRIGNKYMLCFSLAMSFISSAAFYFSYSSLTTLIISAVYVTFSGVSITTVISASVNIFPTTMRTMVVMLVMTFGRVGSLLGNVLFPILVKLGCMPPFIMIGACMLMAFLMSLLLPETSKSALA